MQPLPDDGESTIKDGVSQAIEMLTEWLVDHGTGSEDEDADDPANYFENIDPVIDNVRTLLQGIQETLEQE